MAEDTIKDEEYAPITQGLREYIERHPTMMHAVGLTDLSDNIDAIHKSLEDEYAEMRTFVESLDDAAKKHEDLTLWGVSYTALPLDADGVPIHIGDRMENNERVARIVLTDDSWEPSVYLEKLPNVLHEYFCNEISHYHPDTWERIIEDAIDSVDGGPTIAALVARCKALCERTREGEE